MKTNHLTDRQAKATKKGIVDDTESNLYTDTHTHTHTTTQTHTHNHTNTHTYQRHVQTMKFVFVLVRGKTWAPTKRMPCLHAQLNVLRCRASL